MNRKGFTLIELLAVIVLLGLIMVITVPNLVDVYKKSKVKNEEAFLDCLSTTIDSYVTLNSDTITFNYFGSESKPGETNSVEVYEGTITVQDIINDGLINQNEFVNPGNADATCNPNAEIKVYRDSDYVYCHKIKVSSLGCLTNQYQELYNVTDDSYAIDTCVWSN